MIFMNEKIVTEKDVEYVAKLAKIGLNREEIELYSRQLNGILSFLTRIKELNTESIETAFFEGTSSQHYHEDNVRPSLPQNIALGMTECQEDGYFEVPGIL